MDIHPLTWEVHINLPLVGRCHQIQNKSRPINLFCCRNFSHYKQRFSMPGNTQGMFYSYNLGLAHIISISTEAFYYPQYGNDSIKTQYNWLLNDLKVRIVTLCYSCVNFENKISITCFWLLDRSLNVVQLGRVLGIFTHVDDTINIFILPFIFI